MPEIHETFETYEARMKGALTNIDKPIVISTDVKIPTLTDTGGIKKVPIAWPLYANEHKMSYITTVPAGTHVPRHSHDEDVFRLVTKGSLVLNGATEIKEGMWFVIKANTPYEINTESGYSAVAWYTWMCPATGRGGKHLIEE
jgi:quercetin dioxygenase-like cupin family protein